MGQSSHIKRRSGEDIEPRGDRAAGTSRHTRSENEKREREERDREIERSRSREREREREKRERDTYQPYQTQQQGHACGIGAPNESGIEPQPGQGAFLAFLGPVRERGRERERGMRK